jgi:hypothetical protein
MVIFRGLIKIFSIFTGIMYFDFACYRPFYKFKTNLWPGLIQITVFSTPITDSAFQIKQVMKYAVNLIKT